MTGHQLATFIFYYQLLFRSFDKLALFRLPVVERSRAMHGFEILLPQADHSVRERSFTETMFPCTGLGGPHCLPFF